jgi:hypothetical protein
MLQRYTNVAPDVHSQAYTRIDGDEARWCVRDRLQAGSRAGLFRKSESWLKLYVGVQLV